MAKGYLVIGLIIVGICGLGLLLYASESSIQQRLRYAYFLTTRARHYWHKFKLHRNPTQPIPQRDKGEEGEEEIEKMKEAADSTFHNTKSAVEASARTAANIAGVALGSVKDTLTQRSVFTDPPDEL